MDHTEKLSDKKQCSVATVVPEFIREKVIDKFIGDGWSLLGRYLLLKLQ